jgi:hypothetical protein
MFKVHTSLKGAFIVALIGLVSSTGIASASTPGQGPGQSGDTTIPTSGWVMIYEGCGLCGLQGDQPDYAPFNPGVGGGNGSGGRVEVAMKGTAYPTSVNSTPATQTISRGISYSNGMELDFTEVDDLQTGVVTSITATLKATISGKGVTVLGSFSGTPNMTYTDFSANTYEIAFQNGYVLYIPYAGVGGALELFRPI